MSYINRHLVEGENLLYRAHLHWIIFMESIVCFATALAIHIFLGKDWTIYTGIAAVVGVCVGLLPFINYISSEFGITNRRVIVKVGFIRRRSMEMMLNKVEGVQVNQTILGRILGYGSILVSGTGGSKDPFKNIAAPMKFRKKVQEHIVSNN